jgi:anti-sigma regulatory factor (Ser/Thr protein kinase)
MKPWHPPGTALISPALHAVALRDPSGVSEARRAVAALAAQLGHDEVDAGRAALAATELATNLVKHAGGGDLLLGPAEGTAPPGAIRLLALDRGPGMGDVAACMRDGFSTAGSAGQGLGALRRLAWRIEIDSQPGRGSVVLVVVAPRAATFGTAPTARLADAWSAVTLPKPGQEVSGDGCGAALSADGRTLTLALVDGLGHGPLAAQAAAAALAAFAARPADAPAGIVAAMHAALRHTRGAAVGVAQLGDPTPCHVRFAGLGNIAGLAAAGGGEVRRLVSIAGITGHGDAARRIREFTVELPTPPTVALHSDGIASSGWPAASVPPWPLLPGIHPAVAAALLCRDHARRTDDAAVLVGRLAVS